MSQNPTNDPQKSFAVGRGLLAAAETLNFNMVETHSDSYGPSSQSGIGGGTATGNHLSNTMKLFASLGLSPSDLDALAQVPEANISVETLPHLIMQLKNRKGDGGHQMPTEHLTHSSETSYRGGRGDWDDVPSGRLERPGRQSQSSYDYSSLGEPSGRDYDFDYGSKGRQYSELSHDSYRNLGMSTSDSMFMERRMGTPSHGKVQDFLGVMPLMFPHMCTLCDFDVLSDLEWTQHTNGIRHSENRRQLLQMYPDWDPQMPPSRMSLSLDTKSRSDGLLGAAPIGGGLRRGGMSSGWGPRIRSRVVVAKYDRKPLSINSLFALAKPFGTIVEHLILNTKGFMELQTHEEALAMANFYQRKPAILHGKEIKLYLSKDLLAIRKNERPQRDNRNTKKLSTQVVFFSNLNRDGDKAELLSIARRFGTVEKHLFLHDKAFIQLSSPEDAEMMVKYYTANPLTLNKRLIRMNLCTKYKTLTIPPGLDDDKQESARKSSANRPADKSTKRATASKAKETSAEKKEDMKLGEAGDESGDEEGNVLEAHDGDKAFLNDRPTAEEEMSGEQEENSEWAANTDDNSKESDVDPVAQPDLDSAHEDDPTKMNLASDEKEDKTVSDDEERAQQTKDQEQKDGQTEDEGQEEDADQEGLIEGDFPENLDEFVTLDELAEEEDAERQDSKSRDNVSGNSNGLRVVNVVGFKRAFGYLQEILALSKPFGTVVRHLVLDVRPEAFLEFTCEKEAKAMVDFYSGNVIPSVCGNPSGRVIYVGKIPNYKGSDAQILKLATPFGKIKKYYMNRARNECFIEMERGEDAEKIAAAYFKNQFKFQGKRLLVYVSRKYKNLRQGLPPPPMDAEDKKPLKRERSKEPEPQSLSSGKSKDKKEEEPSVKKAKVEDSVKSCDEAKCEEETENGSTEAVLEEQEELCKEAPEPEIVKAEHEAESLEASDAPETETSINLEEKDTSTAPSDVMLETSHSALEPYNPDVPVGVDFVKMGYYCRVCFLFYSNEDTAKKVHCSSQAHYNKLKKHLEKEKAKAQRNETKK
ncbi:hypothetical protein DNTS_008199 [Danionella cerebrum]|uniref:Matrin-type domain-containing protein n=1 Tax=Danionella cerebrum TaxID=2873325 RepID=A0A553R5J7_9TELE|nr:hypothetical protein DNTS_008199 [Danionella translucida]